MTFEQSTVADSTGRRATGATFQVRVGDFDRGRDWYERLFDREPDFVPHEGFVEWEFVPGTNCWLQVGHGDPAPGSGPVRLGTTDLDGELSRLRATLDVDPPEVHRTPDGLVRYCTFTDPFGNRVGLFEEVDPADR